MKLTLIFLFFKKHLHYFVNEALTTGNGKKCNKNKRRIFVTIEKHLIALHLPLPCQTKLSCYTIVHSPLTA